MTLATTGHELHRAFHEVSAVFFNREREEGATAPGTITSVLGADMQLQGDIHFKGKMRIDGSIEGNIQGAYLILGETGSVTGEIEVETFVCSGQVHGNVRVEKLSMIRSGRIEGRVETMDLTVESGAVLNGEVRFRNQELRLVPGSGREDGGSEEVTENRKLVGRK